MELERLQWVFCGSHNFCSCSLFTSNKFGRSYKDQEPAQQAQWIFAREGKLLLEVRDTKCKTTISSDWVFSSAWLVHANLTTRKGKLAKTNFSQRSLPSYNLIKPQQSTFKAARPQILVRRTRPKSDLARKEPVRLGVKGKTTKPSLLQVPRIFSVHKIWLNGPSLRGFGAREHAWPNAVRRCCWALIMAGGPLHGGHN